MQDKQCQFANCSNVFHSSLSSFYQPSSRAVHDTSINRYFTRFLFGFNWGFYRTGAFSIPRPAAHFYGSIITAVFLPPDEVLPAPQVAAPFRPPPTPRAVFRRILCTQKELWQWHFCLPSIQVSLRQKTLSLLSGCLQLTAPAHSGSSLR